MSTSDPDVTVVGGGLAGLAAATLLARRGLRVLVLERAADLGGRAATQIRSGFAFNLGAHALYRGGAAARILAQIGVPWSGREPPVEGIAVKGGEPFELPSTLGGLVRTGVLRTGSKLRAGAVLARMPSPGPSEGSLGDWLSRHVPEADLRDVLAMFVRLATYADAPKLLSAHAAFGQLRLGQTAGVAYLDGGWGTLVTEAARAAREAGAEIRTGAPVVGAAPRPGGFHVAIERAAPIGCGAIVLAVGPKAARSILASDSLARHADAAVPTQAACLDVALRRLPNPKVTFALGVDRPIYLSVHSNTARLGPEGAAIVSMMKYLPPGSSSDPRADEAELEGWLDRWQPGWRAIVVERQWLPSMVTSNALVRADAGGLAGRAPTAVTDVAGAFVAGDWVGDEGLLLDAALASAARAAEEVGAMARTARARVA